MKNPLAKLNIPVPVKSAYKKIKSKTPIAAVILLIGLVLAGSYFRIFESYEYQAYDWRYKLQPKEAKQEEIVIIEIWDDALKSIGSWPIGREYHSLLIDVLKKYGARMLGIDILFVEPSAEDAVLEQSIRQFGNAFMCKSFGGFSQSSGVVTAESVSAELLQNLSEAANDVGHVNAVVDSDGTRRRIAPMIQTAEGRFFHLGVLMALHYLGVNPDDIRLEEGRLNLGSAGQIPLDENGRTLVHFAGPWRSTYRHISFLDILTSYRQVLLGEKPNLDLESLRGKVCFLGLTATATHDINPVPVDAMYPQVGIHADIFRNILTQRFRTRGSRSVNLLLLVVLMAGAYQLAKVGRLWISVTAMLATWGLFLALVLGLFWIHLMWIDLFYPSVIYAAVYLASIINRTVGEKRKRELIENELSIATKIQKSFLPKKLPQDKRIHLYAYMHPAKHVGGDLYDMLQIDEERIGIMCGDVSGKGVPAALFMARSVAEFKFNSGGKSDPAEVLQSLNESLSEGESSGLFVTMNYAVVNLAQGWVRFSSGGAMPVLRVRQDGSHDLIDPEGGMPIGLMSGVEFGCATETIEAGDIFIMYSDGISEARNKKREDFEMERLTEAVLEVKEKNPEEIAEHVLKRIDEFVGPTLPQFDDMTIVAFKVDNDYKPQA